MGGPVRSKPLEAKPHRRHLRSRRDILIAGVATVAGAAGATVAAAGSGSDSRHGKRKQTPTHTTPAATTTAAQVDIMLLGGLLDLEQRSIDLYTRATLALTGDRRGVVRSMLFQEREHAHAVAGAIRDLGGTPAPGPQRGIYGVTAPAPRRVRDIFVALRTLESESIGAYVDAAVQIETEDVRVTIAAIMAAEAQHLAVVRGELGEPQLEAPFVDGTGGASSL